VRGLGISPSKPKLGEFVIYLVTGGTGFIGSHLCEALVAAGHDVRVPDDLSTGRCGNLPSAVTLVALVHGSDVWRRGWVG
jgi:nucleoside-diphosphate-sugar epimerase